METIFEINGYYEVNGEKSDFIKLNKTVKTRIELDQIRNSLKEETKHEIHLVHTEMPVKASEIK